ncbi:MAG: hypothetical protein CBR30_02950 [Dictyoglomus sp. NZ13-RE01]|nr:MAG: hypothetical protein CBR30_02950 [Dictyoglomus sp. NZ13-RE01]
MPRIVKLRRIFKIKRNYKVVLVISLLLIFLSGCVKINVVEATQEQSYLALQKALEKLGTPYEYGARGPDKFDCSGLIVWAYKQVIPELKFRLGFSTVPDVNIEELYIYNTKHISIQDVNPGDIIFWRNSEGKISHGGLVIEVKSNYVQYVNASSVKGAVVIGESEISSEICFGRLLIIY